MKSLLLRFFSRNTLHFLRIDLHFLWLRLKNAVTIPNAGKIKPTARLLNVGCGQFGVDSPDWCNVDGWWMPAVDLAWDLRRRLPFESQRFDGIYSEHFFEHLHTDHAQPFLSECFRVLRSNGILRLVVPDAELFLKNYFQNRAWMVEQIDSREWLHAREPSRRTPMAMVNEVFRQGNEHQFCYDFETLSACLTEAGFSEVTRVSFRAGADAGLHLDRPSRRVESLYVEARKA